MSLSVGTLTFLAFKEKMEYHLSADKQGIIDGLGNREVMTLSFKLSFQVFFFPNPGLLIGDIIFSVSTPP